jgi:hypothetical protein
MAPIPHKNIAHIIRQFNAFNKNPHNTIPGLDMGRFMAWLNQMQATRQPALEGGGSDGGGPVNPGTNKGSFKDFMFIPSDLISIGAGIAGRAAGAIAKNVAAGQMARGNAPQHFAASMSNPSSEARFGNRLGNLAQIAADAGQAKATGTLATGEAVQGGFQDISDFISSINVMRRLMQGNALTGMGILGMNRLMGRNK